MHEAGVIISPDQISDRTRRLIANQVRPHAVAALEAAAPHLATCRCATLQAKVERVEAERDRLKADLARPCGSCHPCDNWADETWRREGRKPPHFHEWQELKETLNRVASLANEWKVGRRLVTCEVRDCASRTTLACAEAIEAALDAEDPR
jgi:hypothetical protein